MGVDYHGFAVVGVRVTREDFFEYTGQSQYVCCVCLEAYDANTKFCPRDGHQISCLQGETATRGFSEYCSSVGRDPFEVFEALQAATSKESVGLFVVNAYQDCETAPTTLAFGIQISKLDSWDCNKTKVEAIEVDLLYQLVDRVIEESKKIGLPGQRPLELFTCQYVSF